MLASIRLGASPIPYRRPFGIETYVVSLVAGVGDEVEHHRWTVEQVQPQSDQEDFKQLRHHARARDLCQCLTRCNNNKRNNTRPTW